LLGNNTLLFELRSLIASALGIPSEALLISASLDPCTPGSSAVRYKSLDPINYAGNDASAATSLETLLSELNIPSFTATPTQSPQGVAGWGDSEIGISLGAVTLNLRKARRAQTPDYTTEPYLFSDTLLYNTTGDVPSKNSSFCSSPTLVLCLNILGRVLGTVKEPSVLALQVDTDAFGASIPNGFTLGGAFVGASLPQTSTSVILLPRVHITSSGSLLAIASGGSVSPTSGIPVWGSVLAALAALLYCCCLWAFLLRRRKRKEKEKVAPEDELAKACSEEPTVTDPTGRTLSSAMDIEDLPEERLPTEDEVSGLNLDMLQRAEALRLQAKKGLALHVKDMTQKLDYLGRPDGTFAARQKQFREALAKKKRDAAREALKGAGVMQRQMLAVHDPDKVFWTMAMNSKKHAFAKKPKVHLLDVEAIREELPEITKVVAVGESGMSNAPLNSSAHNVPRKFAWDEDTPTEPAALTHGGGDSDSDSRRQDTSSSAFSGFAPESPPPQL